MSKNKNDEPRDEFDRIQIPEFLARPLERLSGRPTAGSSTRPMPGAQPTGDPDADSPDGTEPVAPKAWWGGYRGKLLLYGAGTLVMVFLQTRG
jgi:hypothetical protein